MRLDFVLWAAAGLISSTLLLAMMRRRQLHLIGLLTEYVERQGEWSRRRARTKEIVAEVEKKNSGRE